MTGRPRGVTIDLETEPTAQLGEPLDLVVYANPGSLMEAAALGAWDVAFMPVDCEREMRMDFGSAYDIFESTYLVPSESTIRSIAEVDRAGVRVVVIANTTTARSASQSLKNAELILVRTAVEMYVLLQAG